MWVHWQQRTLMPDGLMVELSSWKTVLHFSQVMIIWAPWFHFQIVGVQPGMRRTGDDDLPLRPVSDQVFQSAALCWFPEKEDRIGQAKTFPPAQFGRSASRFHGCQDHPIGPA